MKFLVNAKHRFPTISPVRYFLAFIICILYSIQGLSQQRSGNEPPRQLRSPSDTDRQSSPPLLSSDTIPIKTDTIPAKAVGDIETTIDYSARDSIRASLDGKMVWLYGDAKIVYGNIELEAEQIVIDYEKSTLSANGTRDSLGQRVGYPVFKNGAEVYETKDIIYNFKTRRARISEVVTAQGDGFLHSDAAFKNENNEILSIRNSYTTCNLEHPHFRIRSTKTKAIPKDKIVSGPFYLEFNDIPLPAAWLFGMFPAKQEASSGIIFPSYGEERRRGFNLRGGGYFFDISEYVKLELTGDIYSKGGHAVYVRSNYMKRYQYNGNLSFAYSKNPDLDDRIETNNPSTDFSLNWSHSPQSKGSGRFSASVNAATSTFNRNNNLMRGTPGDFYSAGLTNITAKLQSNVSYNKRFVGTPFSMGLNVSHSQDLTTRAVDLQLPTLSVNMTNLYPFQRNNGKTGPLDNFSIAYTMNASNRISNNLGRIPATAQRDSITTFDLNTLPRLIANGRKGIRHSIPMSFSMKAFKYFTLSPSVNYEERWYGESYNWGFSSDNGTIVRTDTVNGFTRVANYNTSISLTTRLYGMYQIKNPAKKLKAIRHVMNPTISAGFTPDFTKNRNYFQRLEDNAGNIIYRSRHEGTVYGGSTNGRSGAIGFSLGNNIEAKVKGEKDSVARKVMLLNNLSFNTNYNLLADSFALAPIGIAANTNILENLINLNFAATLNPYSINNRRDPETGIVREKFVDALAWRNGRLGRITNATLNLSTNLNPKARSKETTSREKIAKSDMPEQEKQFLLQNPDAYVDFEIPWSLNLGYNVSYTHGLNEDPRIVQHLQFSGDVSISQQWKITYSSGYDFEQKEMTITNLGITRDLHCWTMRLNWVPFGRFQMFDFTIAVKASVLQDLKLERRKSFQDNL